MSSTIRLACASSRLRAPAHLHAHFNVIVLTPSDEVNSACASSRLRAPAHLHAHSNVIVLTPSDEVNSACASSRHLHAHAYNSLTAACCCSFAFGFCGGRGKNASAGWSGCYDERLAVLLLLSGGCGGKRFPVSRVAWCGRCRC